MPHQETSKLVVKPLHDTFAAEITGVDFKEEIPDDVFEEIIQCLAKYGVVRFPNTGLDDAAHVAFAARFGELDDVSPYTKLGRKNRLAYEELFDVSNLYADGSIIPMNGERRAYLQANNMFHVDCSYNPRRASYCLLRAHELPPPGTGGATEYADARTAFDDLPDDVKDDLLRHDYLAHHSLYHSRKMGAPEFFANTNVTDYPMAQHRLVQRHEPSGRMNLYIASHVHHLDGVEEGLSRELIDRLYRHACQRKYVVSIPWENPSDLIVWDNTCVMHRATGGSFEGKYKRDMRRATVFDDSSQAWGMNDRMSERQGLP